MPDVVNKKPKSSLQPDYGCSEHPDVVNKKFGPQGVHYIRISLYQDRFLSLAVYIEKMDRHVKTTVNY